MFPSVTLSLLPLPYYLVRKQGGLDFGLTESKPGVFIFFLFVSEIKEKRFYGKQRHLSTKERRKYVSYLKKGKSIFMYALSEVKTTRKRIIIPLSENRGKESLKIRQYRKVLSYKYDWEILPGKENTGMKKTILSVSPFLLRLKGEKN